MAEAIREQGLESTFISYLRYLAAPAMALNDFTFNQRVIFTPLTFADQDTTPSVRDGFLYVVTNTVGATITDFDDGVAGQMILLSFTDANTTITDGGNIALSAAFTGSANDTMILVKVGTTWQEVARSVN